MSKEINETIPGYLKNILGYTSAPTSKYRGLHHKTIQHWFLFHLFQSLTNQYSLFNIHQVAKDVEVNTGTLAHLNAGYLKTPDGKLTGFKYTLRTSAFLESGDGLILVERIASEFCTYVTHLFSGTDKLSDISREFIDDELTIWVTWSTPWEAILTTGDKA